MASVASPLIHASPATMSSKRKARTPKSCYPCYRRKVKCDRTSPCSLCVKRGHAHLCTYVHPRKDAPTSPTRVDREDGRVCKPSGGCHRHATVLDSPTPISRTADAVVVDSKAWKSINEKLAGLSNTIASLRSQLESARTKPVAPPTPESESHYDERSKSEEGVHMRNGPEGSSIHFGSSSVLAFLLDRRPSPVGTVFQRDNILPQLALENQTATYPFLDLWSPDITSSGNGAICAALPDDRQCRRFLRCYRDVRWILYPVLADIDSFEQNVETMLRNRAAEVAGDRNSAGSAEPFGFGCAFIGLLFAVLASGCQLSELPKKERKFQCQLYVCCAYQCLRNCNFLSRPTPEAIQTLLILGDVLSYDMNPGISYVIFGLAQRMALTLGLHIQSIFFSDEDLRLRQRLWWLMAWQDSHFALSYDRPVETLAPSPPIPQDKESRQGKRNYFETMCRVISLTLQLLREEILSPEQHIHGRTIPTYKTQLEHILADAEPYLRKEEYCFNIIQHIERLTLRLRSSYLVSEICRRSLKQSHEGKKTNALCGDCIESLISTIESYVQLHELIPHGSRSWIHLHSAISAAFLLAVDEGAQTDPATWDILEKLETTLTDLTTADAHDIYADTPSNVLEADRSDLFPSNAPTTTSPPLSSSTYLLSDLRSLAAELAIHDPMQTPIKLEKEGGFLVSTRDSLRKINAEFRALKEKLDREGAPVGADRKRPCCTNRCNC